jgi:segregation and condensation protein A
MTAARAAEQPEGAQTGLPAPPESGLFPGQVYQVQLPQFEGPFDLLLFFIQRDELDIRDIPIHSITHDFLDYLHRAQQLQLNLAAEFIVVAAQLMKIKAKMLLPRPRILEDGTVEDPRAELVDRLIEYQRYKQVLVELERLEEEQFARYKRGYTAREMEAVKGETEPQDDLHGLTLFGLLKVYKRLLDKHNTEHAAPRHVIQAFPYRMEDVRERVRERVYSKGRLGFAELVNEHPNRYWLVFTFLTILELINQRVITVVAGEGYNNFWLQPTPAEEASEPKAAA